MRTIALITCIVMVSMSSLADTPKAKRPAIHIISTRLDCFYFKVDKELIGAEIEVYSDKGEKLATQAITRKRAIVDFYYENPGRYTIRITKGDVQESFEYEKNTNSPFIPLEIARINITQ